MRNLILFFCLNLTLIQGALASIIISKDTDGIEISNELQLGKDDSVHNSPHSLEFGYFPGEKWASVTLVNQSYEKIEKIIFFQSLTGFVKAYDQNTNNKKLNFLADIGTSTPLVKRVLPSIFSSLPITLEPQSEKTIYFNFKSRHNFNTPVFLGNSTFFHKKEEQKKSFLDFYVGGILCLIIYNFFIFLSLRDCSYLFYCFFSGSFMMAVLNVHGYLDYLFRPTFFSFSHYLLAFSATAMLSATNFSYHYLQIKKTLKKAELFYKVFFFSNIFLILITFSNLEDLFPHIFGTAIDLLIVFGNLVFMINSYQLLRISTSAKFYLFSWFLLIITLLCYFGMTFGFFPQNFFTEHALLFGNLIQMLTISLALAHRINELTKEKQFAEERALQKDRYQRLVRVLSHDIANSLTIINSYSKKLLKKTSLERSEFKMAEKIFFSAENIRNILNNVREQELLPSRKNQLELEPVNIMDSIQSCLFIFEEQIRHKNLKLTLNIPSELFIMANRVSFINNIANNIISNSIKFSKFDSSIEIKAFYANNNVEIHFNDFGKGIFSEKLDEIFFSQKVFSSEGTIAETGHGFGANLMREYVELYNGILEVSSTHETIDSHQSGTRIKITFPLPSGNLASHKV